MGDFIIIIKGIGAHHNEDNPTDADLMARGLVIGMKDNGHNIEMATIATSNGLEKLD